MKGFTQAWMDGRIEGPASADRLKKGKAKASGRSRPTAPQGASGKADSEALCTVTVNLPLRTVSESNRRGHWTRHHKRTQTHRMVAKNWIEASLRSDGVKSVASAEITLARVAPRRLDPGNLEASFKAVQDGVADALGIDDGDERLRWHYDQRRGRPKEYAVEVTIRLRKEKDDA